MYCKDFDINDETSVEFELRKNAAAGSIKKLDRNYEKYSVPFNNKWTDGKYYKKIVIENYGSGLSGTFIRNAVTGARYNIMVGSADQDIFFKVIDATGRNGRKENLMLYYDSPEQYENHNFTIVSPDVKKVWNQKFLQAKKRLKWDWL